MRYIATYLLLQLGGTTAPSGDDIRRVLDVVHIVADEIQLQRFLSAIEGKDVAQLIQEGSTKFAIHAHDTVTRPRDFPEQQSHEEERVPVNFNTMIRHTNASDSILRLTYIGDDRFRR